MLYILTNDNPGFFARIWNSITGFFARTGNTINEWMRGVFRIDERLGNLYDNHFAPLPEYLKILILIVLSIIIIVGTFQLIKKTFKLFLLIVVILVALYLISLFLR